MFKEKWPTSALPHFQLTPQSHLKGIGVAVLSNVALSGRKQHNIDVSVEMVCEKFVGAGL